MANEPSSVKVRMYNVGFGDCFLLSFYYKKPMADQHILIDFGTVGGKANMKAVANDIKKECGRKLYAVVATHRHRDHIGGFSNAGGPASTGAIIASLKPEIVVQPWTENPSADAMADSAPLLAKKQRASDKRIFMASLAAMSSFQKLLFVTFRVYVARRGEQALWKSSPLIMSKTRMRSETSERWIKDSLDFYNMVPFRAWRTQNSYEV